jgi:8-oxo-dGTP pyrophosphatase MutT (NUDIX family)
MGPVKKVLAYVVREREGRRELLVFTHRDYPDAGLQVPAGTVDEGEEVLAALFREVEEETGLAAQSFGPPIYLGAFNHWNDEWDQPNARHVFVLPALGEFSDTWEWTETSGGKGKESYVFQFRWARLDEPIDLAGGQGEYLRRVP